MRALLLVCLPAVAIAQPAAKPQPPTTPAQALAKVEATYAEAKEISGEFVQSTVNATFGTQRVTSGTFAIAKPDKLRFDYISKKKKLDKTFVFDGTTFWYEEPLSRKVTKTNASASELPAAFAFLTAPGQLAKTFTVGTPTDKSHLMPGMVVLELTPKQPSATYQKLELVVDPTTWTVGGTVVYAPSGDSTTFELRAVDLAAKLPPERFAYVPPKGYEVKILRPEPAPKRAPKKAPAAPPKRP